MLALTASVNCSPSSADKAGPTATVATEVPTTATTNPYAIPTVIDAAYVNRVLAGLDAAMGDVVRIVFRTRAIPPEAIDRLKSVSATADILQLYIDGLQLDMRAGFKEYRPDIGNKSSVVTQIIAAGSECIFARVQRDYSAVSTDTSSVINPQWVGLKRTNSAANLLHYNPTPWVFAYDGFPRDRSQPPSPCAS